MARVSRIEKGQEDFEAWQTSVDNWREAIDKQAAVIERMVKLFETIENSLWLLVKIGNGVKWLLGIVTSLSVAYYAVKFWIKAGSATP